MTKPQETFYKQNLSKMSKEKAQQIAMHLGVKYLPLILRCLSNKENVVYSKYEILPEYSQLDEITYLHELFNLSTGHMISITDYEMEQDRKYNLHMNPHGPHLADISITNHCEMGCPYCYVDAKQTEEFMTLDYLQHILSILHRTVFSFALGGGEPTCHPAFGELLRTIREDFNIIPNYTTNGMHLTDNILNATKAHCGAVAVSKHHNEKLFKDGLHTLMNHGIKTNVHWVVGKHSIDEIIWSLDKCVEEHTPLFNLGDLNAVVFLLNKPTGRSSEANNLTHEECLRFSESIDKYLQTGQSVSVGFDSCFSPIMNKYTNIDKAIFDTCDGGRFSIFGDYNGNWYPCSFDQKEKKYWLSPDVNNYEDFINKVWFSIQFDRFRRNLSLSCTQCSIRKNCMGGCPILDIVVCDDKAKNIVRL